MLASHTFRPRTSIHNKNAAVNSTFIYPLYRGRVAFNYRVLYIVTFYAFAAFSQCHFYLLSAHLAMHIVDLHLYWWPFIFCYLCVALSAQCQFSAYCYSSSCVFCSFSLAYRRRVFQLINLGVVPLQGALIPYMRSSVWRISFSTRQSCTVDALCIAVTSIYTSIGGTAALRFSTAYNVLLQAPMILHRYWFYSFSKGTRELFTNSLLFNPILQIQALYSIIGLTTAIYSSYIRLKDGPQVNTIIYNTAVKAAAPLQITYMICMFQFSLVSI